MNDLTIMDNETKDQAGPCVAQWIDVLPIHCHKRRPENTLVSRLRVVTQDTVHAELQMHFDHTALPFFFDHEIDHLPGMLEACGLRQCGLALAHLVYRVPMDYMTIMRWVRLDMYMFGDLSTDTIVESELLDQKRSNAKISLDLKGVMKQNGVPLMEMRGSLVCIHPRLKKRVRHWTQKADYAASSPVS